VNGIGYTAALGLAIVFGAAGLAKVGRVAVTAAGLRAFGLGAVAGPLAVVLPLVEVAVAVGLVLRPAVAAPIALALLVAFSAVLRRGIRAGVVAGCGCFGGVDRRPVRPRDLARNGALGAGATVAWLWPGPAAIDAASVALVSVTGAGALVAAALWDLRRATGGIWTLDLPREAS